MKKLKKKEGITLIALVVTIVVLLILAGVSISMLTGENGIIKQAVESKDKTKLENSRELIELEVLSSYDQSGKLNMSTLKENLSNNLGIDTSNIGTTLPTGTITLNGYDFYIDESTKVIYGDIPISAKISAFNYGDYVDYSIDLNGDGNTTNDWKIFYSDGENVFIIAADYVSTASSYLESALTEVGFVPKGTYGLSWISYQIEEQSVDEATLKLFKSSWTDYNSYENGRVVSTLLNVKNWTGFVDNNYANCAIGGPTVEMLVASYNAKGYTQLFTNTSSCGYYVGTEENPTETYVDFDDNGSTDLLYVPRSDEADLYCNGYWLASPGSSWDYYIMNVRINIGRDNIKYRNF